jgi:lipopolysaccharide/colanic/teichoic acid biosynthesis glycosyltransferase
MDRKVAVAKRALDLLGGAVGLAVSLPLYPVIAAAIKLDSKGPIFYRQRRAGMLDVDGDYTSVPVFEMFKFRTMRTDAEKASGAVLARDGDPRITRVGRFLRKSRLDEIPQFLNVLRGQMSIVGPRPERPELIQHLALAVPFFHERARLVKPGITGLAQIELDYAGRLGPDNPLYPHKDELINPFKLDGLEDSDADDMRTKMLYDFAYAATLENFWEWAKLEARILVRTPLIMILGRGR